MLLLDVLKNPLIIGAILALIRNIGGYIYNCLEAGKILRYNGKDLLVTLGLWETFFTLFMGLGSFPLEYTTVVTAIIEAIRSFRNAVTGTSTDTTAPAPTPPLPAVPEDAYQVKVGDTFMIADVQNLITQGYKRWYFPDGHMYQITVLSGGLAIGQTMTSAGWVGVMPAGWHPIDTHPSS
jgi:hypothetical protein